jgi:hypothetical protein
MERLAGCGLAVLIAIAGAFAQAEIHRPNKTDIESKHFDPETYYLRLDLNSCVNKVREAAKPFCDWRQSSGHDLLKHLESEADVASKMSFRAGLHGSDLHFDSNHEPVTDPEKLAKLEAKRSVLRTKERERLIKDQRKRYQKWWKDNVLDGFCSSDPKQVAKLCTGKASLHLDMTRFRAIADSLEDSGDPVTQQAYARMWKKVEALNEQLGRDRGELQLEILRKAEQNRNYVSSRQQSNYEKLRKAYDELQDRGASFRIEYGIEKLRRMFPRGWDIETYDPK